MKFYYNGKLVRTSKTHEYHFAIIGADGRLWSCHGTLEGAQKEFRRPISECERGIENSKTAIKMIEAGKRYYFVKEGRMSIKVELYGTVCGEDLSKVSTWEKWIESKKARIEFLNTRKIVELEMRG